MFILLKKKNNQNKDTIFHSFLFFNLISFGWQLLLAGIIAMICFIFAIAHDLVYCYFLFVFWPSYYSMISTVLLPPSFTVVLKVKIVAIFWFQRKARPIVV